MGKIGKSDFLNLVGYQTDGLISDQPGHSAFRPEVKVITHQALLMKPLQSKEDWIAIAILRLVEIKKLW